MASVAKIADAAKETRPSLWERASAAGRESVERGQRATLGGLGSLAGACSLIVTGGSLSTAKTVKGTVDTAVGLPNGDGRVDLMAIAPDNLTSADQMVDAVKADGLRRAQEIKSSDTHWKDKAKRAAVVAAQVTVLPFAGPLGSRLTAEGLEQAFRINAPGGTDMNPPSAKEALPHRVGGFRADPKTTATPKAIAKESHALN